MRYIVEFVERDGQIDVYEVTDTTRPQYDHAPDAGHWATDVWLSDGKARCVACRGPLVAMSASCAHAKAVMRYVAARQGEK